MVSNQYQYTHAGFKLLREHLSIYNITRIFFKIFSRKSNTVLILSLIKIKSHLTNSSEKKLHKIDVISQIKFYKSSKIHLSNYEYISVVILFCCKF